MKAYLNNYRQSPRKVRLVASLIRGKSAELALVELNFLPKRAALPIQKLLLSAVANAVSMGVSKENLFVKEIMVDKGVTLRRMMPAAMGSGHRINKRTSHVALILGEKVSGKNIDKKRSKKETKKVAIKEPVKKVEAEKAKKIIKKSISKKVKA
jgi:large subunit ribosomal protein L22